MITVRFPSGFCVQYNNLDHADFRPTGTYLSTKKSPNTYSVLAPLDCIIEHVSPCRTYDASGQPDDLRLQVRELGRQIDSLKRAINKKAKS